MFSKVGITAVAICAMATPIWAQGFSGGELSIDVYALSDGDDLASTNYSGALEYAITSQISVAASVSIYDYGLLDDSVNNLTLHGIYALNRETSVGVFIGTESLSGEDVTLYGLEGAYSAGALDVEGYIGFYDEDADASIVGLSGAYQITGNIAAIGTIGFGDVAGDSVNRYSLGAEYEFNAGPSVFAEIGSLSVGDADDTFIGLGASIEFGGNDGVTFDRRGLFATAVPDL